MLTWETIKLPQEPSPNYILVNNISLGSTDATVKEFFLFCGKIKEFELQIDETESSQVALIHFERESAARTASLLSNALLDEQHITAVPYYSDYFSFDDKASDDGSEASQESKPKTRIVAEILANGYILQDQIVAKGLQYDQKYHFSTTLSSYLNVLQSNVKHFDDKYRIWDRAVEIDQKYKLQEKMQFAVSKAQEALNTPTGQKVHGLASQTMNHIATVHYEAKRIQNDKLGNGHQSLQETEEEEEKEEKNEEAKDQNLENNIVNVPPTVDLHNNITPTLVA
ncbi:hypothetical protein BJ944DRAFT_263724 [Cunninghamella echinulata]|nr:hypothetical protein BJ944DRAFT_263724 [Cunninghamella echinulata]